jgi:hypothetical protein
MKKVLMCSAVALLFLGLAYALSSRPLTADIPFPFYVGDAQMTAGEYLIQEQQHLLVVRPMDGQPTSAVIFGYGVSTKTQETQGKLVFTKYVDGNYFLSQIWQPFDSTGLQTMKSKRERESITTRVITDNRPETVVIMAKLVK